MTWILTLWDTQDWFENIYFVYSTVKSEKRATEKDVEEVVLTLK